MIPNVQIHKFDFTYNKIMKTISSDEIDWTYFLDNFLQERFVAPFGGITLINIVHFNKYNDKPPTAACTIWTKMHTFLLIQGKTTHI